MAQARCFKYLQVIESSSLIVHISKNVKPTEPKKGPLQAFNQLLPRYVPRHKTLAKITQVIPVSSVAAERSFSRK